MNHRNNQRNNKQRRLSPIGYKSYYYIHLCLACSILPTVQTLHLTQDSRQGRRDFIWSTIQASSFVAVNKNNIQPSFAKETEPLQLSRNTYQHFAYSNNWVGTALSTTSLEQAAAGSSPDFEMGRWPDPILRKTANRISTDYMGGNTLKAVAYKLRRTARINKAVGLAAQQW